MPTTTGVATEFINFSRASNATVTDSNGVIKWARHNLLLASEQFDASSWTRTGLSSVSANSIAAPNGTLTADKIVENTTLSGHIVQSANVSVSENSTYTYSIFCKPAGRNFAMMQIAMGGVNSYAIVDLTTAAFGTPTNITGSATFSATAFPDGWVRLTSVTTTLSAAAGTVMMYTASNATTFSYTGDGTSGVYLWGAHLYRSDLGGMQANTSAYPMYNPTTPKNLLGYTEDFSTGWVSSVGGTGVATVVTTNAGIAPNGLQTADRIQFSLGGGSTATDLSRRVQAFSTVSSTPYTLSMWVKSFDGSPYTMHLVSAAGLTVNTVSVTNEWQRVSVTANGFGGSINFGIGLRGAQTPTNSNTADILVWGAQLSDSASLDPYVANHFAAPSAAAYYGPRLDFDGSTLAAKGLLVEEQRTNLLLHSAAFDLAPWGLTRATITANAIAAPDGATTADKIVETVDTGTHAVTAASATISLAAHTGSAYLKAAERTWAVIGIGASTTGLAYFDLGTGTVGTVTGGFTASIVAVGNGWYRCSISGSIAASSSSPFAIYPATANNSVSYAGDITKGIYIWGAQFEAGSFATSYIPTTSATVTRNGDVAQVGTAAFPYSATEGAIVLAGDSLLQTASLNLYRGLVLSDSTSVDTNSSIGLTIYNQTALARVLNGGVSQASYSAGTLTINSNYKMAMVYKTDDIAASLNGAAVVTDTLASIPTGIITLSIGGPSGFLNGHIRQITYIPRRLSNAELQARTV